MASRTLRKLQKAQELEKQLAAVREAEAAHANQDDDDSEEEESISIPKKPLNAFDMLDEIDESEIDDDDVDGEPPVMMETESTDLTSAPSQPSKSKKKKKKAKKKGKGKPEASSSEPASTDRGLDEIDRALQDLSAKETPGLISNLPDPTQHDIWAKEASMHLSVESKNLNPVTEMKSLFGNVALENTTAARPQRRREQAQAQQGGMDLGTALSGQQCLGTKGKELGPLAHRRNVFLPGNEKWPGASSGGLSMDHEKGESFFEKKYNIMHDKYYRETQFEFLQFVAMMEPQNLIGLIRMKPYHIATLLQVSEIAKVQGDHSVSGDLLERALFNFGRSVHSTFAAAIKDGSARLNFSKAANREMYLSMWRYIRNLEQRGTWRTAYEWAKLLLQLDPARDPYGVTLMIDQLALRGRQHVSFIEMCSEEAYGDTWYHLPNIQISLALAHYRNKQPTDARQKLAIAMSKYPYILSELAKSLDIEPLPRELWGKLPSTEAETLYTQLYVTRTKDLWNIPELTSLLVEVAETLDHYKSITIAAKPAPKLEISLEEARHIMLLEIPALIGLLPRRFTNMRTSMSDPLPPPENERSGVFTARAPAGGERGGIMDNMLGAAGDAAGNIINQFRNWWSAPVNANDPRPEAAMQDFANRLDLNDEQVQEMLAQLASEHDDLPIPGAFGADLPEGSTPITLDEFLNGSTSRAEENDDSVPDLESIPASTPPPPPPPAISNPLAARVEEDDEEEREPATQRTSAPSAAILRHVDSDDEDDPQDPMVHPEPSHTIFASTSRNSTQAPVIEPTDDIDTTRDPQRIQRWLLSAGLDSIKGGSDPAKMTTYVDRLKVLPKAQRDWTIRIVEQRGGKDLAEQVRTRSGD